MKQYMVLKKFVFKEKNYYQDRLITSEGIGEANIKRLLGRGYIKSIETMAAAYVEPPFYDGCKDLWPPEKVNKLKKPELIEYGKHIGAPGIEETMTVPELRELINNFIADGDEVDLLDPEEVNKLEKSELIEYAEQLGIPDFNAALPDDELRVLVNNFVAEINNGGQA